MRFRPGGYNTFEPASAHHRFNKDSVALREVHNGIFKYNKLMPNIFIQNYDMGTLDEDLEPLVN